MNITPEIVWAIIRQLNPNHSDYPITVTMLARFAKELERDDTI